MSQTIYWHDYETFGVNPSVDRPSQFAGVRTNLDLELIGDPLMIYCQPIPDILPAPDACLITGITPQHAQAEGVPEPEFISKIHAEFSQPQTCGAGYNSLRFDDEVTRYTLYRNFHDPYAREWQNGNSRWDIIDMVRLVYALRPDSLVWPEHDSLLAAGALLTTDALSATGASSASGVPSFKLELLSQMNGLEHESAHDALSDVLATIKLAQHIKNKEPKLYDYCWNLRNKNQVASKIDLNSKKPLLHISSKIHASKGCATIVMPLCVHPKNKNAIICVDLCLDIAPLFELDEEKLRERLYTATDQLTDGEQRIPLKAIHINRCPIVLPVQMLDAENAKRLQIDVHQAEISWQKLLLLDEALIAKAQFAFGGEFEGGEQDADSALYQGFLPDADRRLADSVQNASEEQLKSQNFLFQDERMNELLFRYKARHYPDSLNQQDQALWLEQVRDRYMDSSGGQSRLDIHETDLVERLKGEVPDEQKTILIALEEWAKQFRHRFS